MTTIRWGWLSIVLYSFLLDICKLLKHLWCFLEPLKILRELYLMIPFVFNPTLESSCDWLWNSISTHGDVDRLHLHVISRVVPDYLKKTACVQVLQGLCHSLIDFFMPWVQGLRLSFIGKVEDIEALLEVEYFTHPFEVNKQCMKCFLVKKDPCAPPFGLEGLVIS